MLRSRHRNQLGQTLFVQDLDAAAELAFDETLSLQLRQGPIHHHAACADHRCQVGSLCNWSRGVEDRLPISGEDGGQPLAGILEGPLVEPHGKDDREIG